MLDIIHHHIKAIHDACKQHHVENMYVFGSAARKEDFTSESDIDLLVKFHQLPADTNEQIFYIADNKEALEQKLQKIFECEIDLIEEKNISNKYLRYFINKDKQLLYGLS